MKKTTKRFMTGCVAVALAAVTAFGGFGPAVAHAAGLEGLKEKETINYVSFGDSMANGYGLDGYYEGSIGVNGYLQDDTKAYPSQFADYLERETGAAVNHTQLAISCMRAEDLRFTLELDYEDPEVIEFINTIHNAGCDYANIEAEWDRLGLEGDKFTYDEFVDGRFDDWDDAGYKDTNGGSYTTLDYAEQFQTATKEADVITIGSGNSNFGVFLLHRVVDAVGIFGQNPESYEWIAVEDAMKDLDAESKEVAMELYKELKAQIPADAPEMADAVVELIAYTTVSYMINYKGVLDRIVELNDDADIMIVGLMNTMSGVVLEFYATTEAGEQILDDEGNPVVAYTIDLGSYMDTVMKSMNNYLAGLATVMQATDNKAYDTHTFYFAEAEGLTKADMIYDELETAANANWEGYDIVRDRIVTEYNDTVYGMVAGMFNEIVKDYGLSLEKVSVENVIKYERFARVWEADNTTATTDLTDNQILSCAIYLAFEEATVKGSTLDVLDGNAFVTLAGGLDGVFGGVAGNLHLDMATIGTNVSNAVMADIMANDADEIKAWVLSHQTYGPEIISKVQSHVNTNMKNELADAIAATGKSELTQDELVGIYMSVASVYINTTLVPEYLEKADVQEYIMTNYAPKYIPTYASRYVAADITPALANALTSDSTLLGLFNLFARFLVGNGIGCHPSQTGHNKLAAEVIATYEEEYTVQDETKENVIIALETSAELIAEYYDEAYAYAYQEAKDAGYIDDALNALDDLSAELDKIDVSELDLSAELKAELENTIENAQKTIEQLKNLIEEADVLDQATLNEAIDLLNKLGQNVTDIRETLIQAGYDLADAAWDYYVTTLEPAIKEALQEAVEVGTQKLLELMGDAYDAMVEALTEAAKEYAPEVADYIYNWLYNNPDKVIAFFEEYGDDMVAFMEEYQEEIFMVLGFLISEFGDDVVDYVMENPEEVLDTLVWFYETHGENTWKLIMVYADALGITDALEAGAKEVYEALEEICDYIEGELAELEEIIEAEIAKIEAEIEALKAELEKAGEDAKELIEAEIAKLEAELASLVAQLEAYLENAFEELYVDATTGEYVVDADSKYLSLGDSVAASKNTFAGKLAEELATEWGVDEYTELALEGFRTEDIRYILDETYELDAYGQAKTKAKADKIRTEYIAAIEESDLITITLGNDNFTTFVTDQTKSKSYEMDWERYVTEDGIPYVESVLADVKAEIAKAGLNAAIEKRVEAAVEAYAYGFAGFAFNYTEVLNEIHAINPDAQVVVVGMFNPMDALTVPVEGEDVIIGEYIDYFISMSNQMFTIYSAITPNTTFVPVPETTVDMDELEGATYIEYLLNLLILNSDELRPNDAGHEYIKEQILNAMTLTPGYLKGDVDMNGVVNDTDVNLLYRYVNDYLEFTKIQIAIGNVDDNAATNDTDVNLLYRYVNDYLDEL